MTESIIAAVLISGAPEPYIPSLHALRRALPDCRILIGSPLPDPPLAEIADRFGCDVIVGSTFQAMIRALRRETGEHSAIGRSFDSHVLVVTAPVIVPGRIVDRAVDYLDQDMRVATVSFLSNNAGFLSLPNRNAPSFHLLASHDQETVTDLLRDVRPDGGFASIPLPAGAVHVLSRHALSACDGLRDGLSLSANGLVTEFALRAQRRGFVCAIDAGTFVLATADVGARSVDPIDDPAERPILLSEHPFVEAGYEWARQSEDSPAALVVAAATAKVVGLRITIDGRCLGDREMGTQVQTLALAKELAERHDVQLITIVTNGTVPTYAHDVFARSKVRHELIEGADVSALPAADILHRPYQPDTILPIDEWRIHARRIVVTLQDLIAYQVGAYATDGPSWLGYRDALRRGAEHADGVVVISHDTKAQVAFERLNITPSRIFVVPNGTDHLSGGEATSVPDQLLRRGFGAGRFLFVLGANYAHKNRDLAIAAWDLLRDAYPDLSLVLVGASVPHGSSRIAEAAVTPVVGQGLYALPDVTSAERNWLLHHAEVVVYATSAEGFGLVPFEAARFGTPTVNVDFGPLSEVNPTEGQPGTWAADKFSSAISALLEDPALRTRRVEATLASGDEYLWRATADGLVAAYSDILSRPPVH